MVGDMEIQAGLCRSDLPIATCVPRGIKRVNSECDRNPKVDNRVRPAILILEPIADEASSILSFSLLKSVMLITWLNIIAKSDAS